MLVMCKLMIAVLARFEGDDLSAKNSETRDPPSRMSPTIQKLVLSRSLECLSTTPGDSVHPVGIGSVPTAASTAGVPVCVNASSVN